MSESMAATRPLHIDGAANQMLALIHNYLVTLPMSLLSWRHPATLVFVILNALMAYWIFIYLRPGPAAPLSKPRKTPKAAVWSPPTSSLAYRDYTLDELLPYNGAERPEILLAVDQRIYDVTSAAHHYGPGGSYGALAGRDASRSLATHTVGRFKPGSLQAWDDLHNLSTAERTALNDWVAFFDHKYPRVGTLVQIHSWAGSDNDESTPEKPKGFIIDNLVITPP